MKCPICGTCSAAQPAGSKHKLFSNKNYKSMSHTSSLLLLACIFSLLFIHCTAKAQIAKKSDPNDNRGNTPFFLQDPYDQMCLGPHGFTACDENALWVLTKRTGKKTYSLVSLLNSKTADGMCLQTKSTMFGLLNSDKVAVGPCSSGRAKSWEFEFIDQTHVKLSSFGQCLVRGKKTYKNSMSVQACSKNEFLPLIYHPTAVHENGFYIKAADGMCFDGSKFRSCEGSGSNRLLWGVGIRYVWGEAQRYFFNFHVQDRSSCIVGHGANVEKGLCKDSGATTWSLSLGMMAFGGSGKKCVARRSDDTATLISCKQSHEYLTLEVPSVYTNEQLIEMLQNPVSS